jgi:hypothetical protein
MISYLTIILSILALGLQIQASESGAAFQSIYLVKPRFYATEIIGRFSYAETGTFNPQEPIDNRIVLYNSYARYKISNAEMIRFDRDSLRVAKIQVVFTKYPLNKKDWRTDYYDLLAWRLNELFQLDAALNDERIEWEMVLQTDCTTDAQARRFFHGIVLYLEPLAAIAEEIPAQPQPASPPVENGGFLFREDYEPMIHRSPIQFEPLHGKPVRRQMEPSRLKCPSWR